MKLSQLHGALSLERCVLKLVPHRTVASPHTGETEPGSVASKKGGELLERRRGGTASLRDRRSDRPQSGGDWECARRLQQLRLQKLAHARDLVARQRFVRFGEEAVRGGAARIGIERVHRFGHCQLIEPEI